MVFGFEPRGIGEGTLSADNGREKTYERKKLTNDKEKLKDTDTKPAGVEKLKDLIVDGLKPVHHETDPEDEEVQA
ncbi:MAG: hypothetical protein M3Z36_04615 [Acidobacteriota bacterium]|nr:hypothetical protein [Acidobacteriota bacterium]